MKIYFGSRGYCLPNTEQEGGVCEDAHIGITSPIAIKAFRGFSSKPAHHSSEPSFESFIPGDEL